MYKKLNFKLVGIVFFVLLLAIVLLNIRDKKRGDRSTGFRSVILDADTADITKIVIEKINEKSTPIKLMKEGKDWVIYIKDKSYYADNNYVSSLINSLKELKTRSIVTNDEERWKDYQVTDSLSNRIKLYHKKKLLSDILLGKMHFEQSKNYYNQNPDIYTYVRLANDDNVYMVEGFPSSSLMGSVNDMRNRIISKVNPDSISKIVFKYPGDSSFTIKKKDKQWSIDGVLLDSVALDKYLTTLSMNYSSDFVDDVKPRSGRPDFSLTIEVSNSKEPVVINAFVSDSTNQYLINSTLNKHNYFSGKSGDLFKNIFPGKKGFFAEKIK